MRGMAATALAVAALAVMVVGPASAQRGGFGMRGGAGLLMRPEVQTELKITADQKAKIEPMVEALREEQRERRQELRDATPEEALKIRAAMRAEEMKRINTVLNADQQKRFRQIALQQEGPMAVLHADVATEIGLTEDQKKKFMTLQTEMSQKQRAIFEEAQGDREAMMSKMQALRKETNDKAVALLTDDQKTKWKEITGAPFTLNTLGA